MIQKINKREDKRKLDEVVRSVVKEEGLGEDFDSHGSYCTLIPKNKYWGDPHDHVLKWLFDKEYMYMIIELQENSIGIYYNHLKGPGSVKLEKLADKLATRLEKTYGDQAKINIVSC